jgi:hypothetical protein
MSDDRVNIAGYDYGRVARSPVTPEDLQRLVQTMGFDEFFGPDGKPDDAYKASVKRRFVQWVVDLCSRPFNQAWLDYQHEIGLRRTPDKRTSPTARTRHRMSCSATRSHCPSRSCTLGGGLGQAVMLTLTLWSEPYIRDGLW